MSLADLYTQNNFLLHILTKVENKIIWPQFSIISKMKYLGINPQNIYALHAENYKEW